MSGRDCDIAIIGGGLSGGLIALALAQHRKDVSVRLIESGRTLGGNHRWSWFSSDIPAEAQKLLAPFRKTQWSKGYDVRFPAYRRTLTSEYNSLSSDDFDAGLRRELNSETLMTGKEVAHVEAGKVTMANGDTITTRSIIDCRGFSASPHLRGGWQVFMGRHLRTSTAHGVSRPVIMDATVDQTHGYRFVYVLPLGVNDLFIEDTYYQDSPELDRSALSARIDEYQRENGWEGEPVSFETGVLPVITGGDFAAFQRVHRVEGVAVAGARGGFVHPLTSYTLPQAAVLAASIAEDAELPADQLAAKLESRARQLWRRHGFYRTLGKMLFSGAEPAERYRIFERFYRLREPLIERFYAGRSTVGDKARILVGKPPIPIHRGASALMSSSPKLVIPSPKDHS